MFTPLPAGGAVFSRRVVPCNLYPVWSDESFPVAQCATNCPSKAASARLYCISYTHFTEKRVFCPETLEKVVHCTTKTSLSGYNRLKMLYNVQHSYAARRRTYLAAELSHDCAAPSDHSRLSSAAERLRSSTYRSRSSGFSNSIR